MNRNSTPVSATLCGGFLAILIFTLNIYANDGYMSSHGGNIFPDYESVKDIRMTKERIHISLQRDSVDVYCRFWFICNVDHESGRLVRVGFPNFTSYPAGDSPPLKNFKTKVNGKEVPVISVKSVTTFTDVATGKLVDAEETIESWFVWDVEFKQNDTTFIENWYTGKWGGGYAQKSFEYIIGTGQTWDGEIGDGRITFDHSNLASSAFVAGWGDSAALYPIQIVPYQDSTVYSFRNYRPPKHFTLFLGIVSFWDDPFGGMEPQSFDSIYQGPLGLKYFLMEKKKAGANLRLMRNEIYARHGYVFKDKKLTEYFTRFSWYRPKGNFDFKMLNKYEKTTVNTILEIEKTEKQ
jgi:hypothetical protein